MKKFLSMVMALVMVMSLVTISAGAKDFTDNDTITYDEAVAVVSEVGIVDGYADGDFKPTNTLTRQAAAKIICNLILGPTTAAELHADTAPYRDVPANSKFAGYIAYCQSRGIISGYGDGAFRPGNTLTGYAFMKMLLGALGYDSTLEGYVGDNWSINVAKQALGIKLDKGLVEEFNGLTAVTREQACLYAFNTLQADLVEYGQRLTTSINGTEVTLSSGGAQSRTWNSQQTRYDNIIVDDVIQFAEEYFNKLEKKDDTDKFYRPAYTWIYDKEEIGTYVDWKVMVDEYTSAVTGRELYDKLTNTTLRENDFVYYVDGQEVPDFNGTNNFAIKGLNPYAATDIARSNTKDFGISANGVLTQVFVEKSTKRNERGLITIVSINTWLAQATGDYQESKEFAPMDVYYNWDNASKSTLKSSWNVDVEDVADVVDVTNEDFYLVNISFKDNSKGDVVEIAEPEILEESTITKFSKSDSKVVDKLTTGGEEKKSAARAYFSDDALEEYNQSLLPDHTYNVFLDPYGYVIGVELDDGAKNYVFITGFDRPTSNLSISTANAAAIFLDGTMDTIRVNVTETDKNIDRAKTKGDNAWEYFIKWTNAYFPGDEGCYRLNRWFTYSTNQSGVYTLTPAVRMTATKYFANSSETDTDGKVIIKTANVSLRDNILLNTEYPYSAVTAASGTALAPVTPAVYSSKITAHAGHTSPDVYAPFCQTYATTNNVRAYGNDDSVYITVDMDNVDTRADGSHAITGVNGVYTGVQEVELEIDTGDTKLEEAQIYTVYDRNGYIIGAVTNGEAKGGNTTVAYVLSDVKSERYESATDTHYWEFDAFVNGEKQTLTVKDKYGTVKGVLDTEALYRRNHSGTIARVASPSNGWVGTTGFTSLTQNLNAYDSIVELRFDGDGNVINMNSVLEKDIYNYYLNQGGSSVDDTGNHKKLNLDDAKVYRIGVTSSNNPTWNETAGVTTHHYDSAPDTLMLRGRTLYVTSDRSDEGLALTADAKALTIQMENGTWEHTPYNSVSSAISALADADEVTDGFQFNGEIVAALDSKGAATWVVFINHKELLIGKAPTQVNNLTYIEARNIILKDGLTKGGADNSASPVELKYELNGTNRDMIYTMRLQFSSGNGIWTDWGPTWTTRGAYGTSYTIDSHIVSYLNPAYQWQLVCGNIVGGVDVY